MFLTIQSLDRVNALEIARWHYSSPYDFYNLNLNEVEQNVLYFLAPQNNFYGIFGEQRKLIGFCSFGEDGQVPGGNYSTAALDIGMGIRPDWTGLGWGNYYVKTVVTFAEQKFTPTCLRVTVAEFNKRAFQVWKKAGFHAVQIFENQSQDLSFIILIRKVGIEYK